MNLGLFLDLLFKQTNTHTQEQEVHFQRVMFSLGSESICFVHEWKAKGGMNKQQRDYSKYINKSEMRLQTEEKWIFYCENVKHVSLQQEACVCI